MDSRKEKKQSRTKVEEKNNPRYSKIESSRDLKKGEKTIGEETIKDSPYQSQCDSIGKMI
jgi:hypothetical protein